MKHISEELPQGKVGTVVAVVALILGCIAGISIYVFVRIDTPKTGDVKQVETVKSSADQTFAPGYPPEYSPPRNWEIKNGVLVRVDRNAK